MPNLSGNSLQSISRKESLADQYENGIFRLVYLFFWLLSTKYSVYFEIALFYFNEADLIPKALDQNGNWQASYNIYRRKLKIYTASISDEAFSMNKKRLEWAAIMHKEYINLLWRKTQHFMIIFLNNLVLCNNQQRSGMTSFSQSWGGWQHHVQYSQGSWEMWNSSRAAGRNDTDPSSVATNAHAQLEIGLS